jgi:ankyrin repeat protein/ribosomal protein S18 acetylase RimI-like enzyme
MPSSTTAFLDAVVTPEQKRAATVSHHRQWFTYQARIGGGEVRRERGATWVLALNGDFHSIAFPKLKAAVAGEQIDAILAYYRSREPRKLVICWSADPPCPRDLGARLMARGFDSCWPVNWMWLDLRQLREEHPRPPGLRVGVVEDEAFWDVEDLPHYSPEIAAACSAAAKARPRRVWHFGAWLDDHPVGHSTLFVTTGRLGIAGIWSCGVVPAARNQGIGRAVTLVACQFARQMGCRYAMLNSTPIGEPVYRCLGFEKLEVGTSWWLDPETLTAAPPTTMQVALAEAAARGDVTALEAMATRVDSATLDERLPSSATLVELAARARQPRSVMCLERHGATLDVLSAWELGWRARVPELLTSRPELAEHRWGRGQHAPLHLAADRGDGELVRVLLDAGADTEIAEGGGATPLHFAAWRGFVEIARLLLDRGASLEARHQTLGTPLMTAIYGSASGSLPGSDHIGVAAALLDAGALVDGPDAAHRPLHLAIRLKHLPIARLLLERGAAVNLADEAGRTPLQIAWEEHQVEMVKLLAENNDGS